MEISATAAACCEKWGCERELCVKIDRLIASSPPSKKFPDTTLFFKKRRREGEDSIRETKTGAQEKNNRKFSLSLLFYSNFINFIFWNTQLYISSRVRLVKERI